VSYYRLNRKGTLLDLGCGTGELTVPLAQYFEKAIGLDPSPETLDEARSRTKENNARNIQ
jgi:ubiquinone/menaquinone biosynthesis C-methylase UbiE